MKIFKTLKFVVIPFIFLAYSCLAGIDEIKKGKNLSIALMLAHQNDGGMGIDGHLPWKLKEDMQHFRTTTTGHTIIMGRRTFEAIGRPLPHRRNVIISHTLKQIEGVEVYKSTEEALSSLKQGETVFIIGGVSLYAQFLPYTDVLYRTLVDAYVKADTFFKLEIDPKDWKLEHERFVKKDENNEYDCLIQVFSRQNVTLIKNNT